MFCHFDDERTELAMSYLLSVDPGLRKAGWALWLNDELQAARIIETKAEEGITNAIEAMTHELCQRWLNEYKRQWCTEPFIPGHSLRLACEYPQTYGGRAKKGDANDLIAVALVAGALVGRLGVPSRLILPREWKGSISKPETKAEYERDGYVVEERNKAKLSAEEYHRIEWPRDWKKRLDVADAVGIGLYALGH